ncbi:hypothetical protein QFZ71_005625 [Streptomyces sp. V2I9]|nr:hypothetical protein [Streptomyces sp. V2I9]
MRMRMPHRIFRRVSRSERPPRPAHRRRRTGVRIALAVALTAIPAAVALNTGQAAGVSGLDDPVKKEIAMQIVSTAENSSLQWREQFDYIEDIGDGRGYTAGIVGFCSGTHDMLELVEYYTAQVPGNPLAKYLPALRAVDGSDSHEGLDPGFTAAWEKAAATPEFRAAQEHERDRVYFDPSVSRAKSDGLRVLGQFVYYDAIVMHGRSGFDSIRAEARNDARTPAEGGDETAYLDAFLDARVVEMKKEAAHEDTSRVDTAQRVFLRNGQPGPRHAAGLVRLRRRIPDRHRPPARSGIDGAARRRDADLARQARHRLVLRDLHPHPRQGRRRRRHHPLGQ